MEIQLSKRFLPALAFDEELANEPRTLPGLYPWLRQGEYFTRDDWVKSFGINLDLIDQKAATAYLDGEVSLLRVIHQRNRSHHRTGPRDCSRAGGTRNRPAQF